MKIFNVANQLRSIVIGVALVVPFSTSVKAQTETYNWGNAAIGGGGFVSGIITSKTEQNLMYARTDVGGAYRWDVATTRWVPLLDWVSENELGYLGVESIAIDPVETNKVYMLVGTSYFNNGKTSILRSSDYGNTFSITDVTTQFKAHGNGMGRQTGEKLQVDPNSANILFCGTRANGLFKSSNSGATWSRLSGLNITSTTNSNGISFVVLDPSTGSSGVATQTIIAGISQTGSNMYRSNDGGTTFTAITGGPTTLMPHRATLASDGRLYITYANAAGPWDISGAGQIWKYNLQSGAWTNVTPTGFAGAFGGISVDPNNASRLVASSINTYQAQDGSWGDRIFLSTNGGTSWVDVVNRGFDLDANGSPWIEGNAIHWAGSIEFDPFDTKKAWVISGNGVFQTDDIDATINVWKFQVNGLEETVPLDIVSIANGPVVSVIGDYDGFRHTDVTQYAPIHTPRMGTTYGITFASLNPKMMLRIGDEKIYYSEDMGITWTETIRKNINQKKGSVAISADGEVFLYSTEGSTTYRSSDRGSTWNLVSGLSIAWSRPVAEPIDPKTFYAYSSSTGKMMVSHDKGISFSASGTPGTGGSQIIRVIPNRSGDIWVALNGNGLTRSIDGGANFSKISGVTYCSAFGFGKEAIGKTYPTLYIYGTVGGILGIHRSTDEGVTWTRVNDDDHEYGGPANGQFVQGDMNVYGRVYMSTAGRGIVYGESSDTCIPTLVVPNIQVNAAAVQQTSITSLDQGDNIVFSPEPTSGGSWSWEGPNSFTSTDREITFTNIQTNQAGMYFVKHTNAAGCESGAQTFTVTVILKVQIITVSGENNISIIDQKGGTLQMVAGVTPTDATEKTVTWSTSNTSLATIFAEGILTAVADGTVTVQATATDGSGVSGEIEIIISNQTVTGTEEDMDSRFGIYPNPVANFIFILHAQKIASVSILDSKGSIVKKIFNQEKEMSLSVSDLAPGIYLLNIVGKDKTKYSKRIIKY